MDNDSWKFSIDFDTYPDYSKMEVRNMVQNRLNDISGCVRQVGDDIYVMRFNDAFAFRMSAGHLVRNIERITVE